MSRIKEGDRVFIKDIDTQPYVVKEVIEGLVSVYICTRTLPTGEIEVKGFTPRQLYKE